MNNRFYERCKRIVAELSLTYEQGVAREVILNELDNLEKQAEDYQKRFNKAIENLQIGIDTYNNGGSRTSLFECISDSIDILEGKNE